MTFFEGGIHTPFFVKWPARLARRARRSTRRSRTSTSSPPPRPPPARRCRRDRTIDGVNLLPFLRGEAPAGRTRRSSGARATTDVLRAARLEAAGLRAADAGPGSSTSRRSDGADAISPSAQPEKRARADARCSRARRGDGAAGVAVAASRERSPSTTRSASPTAPTTSTSTGRTRRRLRIPRLTPPPAAAGTPVAVVCAERR